MLISGYGSDVLRGAGGDDRLVSGLGDNDLYGGKGDDVLVGRDGDDYFFTSPGRDRYIGGKGRDRVDFTAHTMRVRSRSPTASRRPALSATSSSESRSRGQSGDDGLVGTAAGELLIGGEGSDVLDGALGDDTLRGGTGHDGLAGGGDGNDRLLGEEGRDISPAGRETTSCTEGPIRMPSTAGTDMTCWTAARTSTRAPTGTSSSAARSAARTTASRIDRENLTRATEEQKPMECDVAVLGGGPGGYGRDPRRAAGRQDRLYREGARLGGTCLRVGCIPTKAWVQTAFAIKEADETFAKLGVHVGEPQLDFATANQWKDGVVKQMTGGVGAALQGERRRVGQGRRPLHGREHDRGRGRGGRHLPYRHRRDRQLPDASADRGARLTPCVDSTGLLAQQELPSASSSWAAGSSGAVRIDLRPVRFRGHDHRDAPEPHPARGRGCREGSQSSSASATSLHLEKQCTKVEDSGSALTVHFGEARPWRPT